MNEQKLYGDHCSICLDLFSNGDKVMVTPCYHSFHEECLMDWVNTKIRKICEDMPKEMNAYAKLKSEGPGCPNCNESIIDGKKIKFIQ